ncbi:hypothetical protein [Streptomyces sp. NPDC101165]|uniref:hypothetical protein n=1 Tax=Streptomyces sp. NPDC101165 TaxID=3366119 RepID=UPI0037FA59F9
MKYARAIGLAVVAALGVGAGAAFAHPGTSEAASPRSAVTHIVAGAVNIAPGQTGVAITKECPPGELVTGGGSFASSPNNPDGEFTLSRTAPRFPHDGLPLQWLAAGKNTGNVTVGLTVFGLCTESTLASAVPSAVTPLPPALLPSTTPKTH